MNQHLEGLRALVGEWTTEAVHPIMPDTVVPGRTSFEWLEGEKFLILRSWNDHPQFPDSISIIGETDEEEGLTMHYFDSRGSFRVARASMEDGVWRIWSGGPAGFRSDSAAASATTARRSRVAEEYGPPDHPTSDDGFLSRAESGLGTGARR